MTLLAGKIGQMVVPSDGLGAVTANFVIDYTNELCYTLTSLGIRKYSITPPIATQNPLLSVATLLNSAPQGAVDGSGFLIVQSLAAGGNLNGQPVSKIDPSTLTVTGATFGGSTSFPSYPTSVWAAQSIVCLTVNSVSYALIKESENSNHVAVIRTDDMTAAGAYIASSTGGDGRSFMCVGPNSSGLSATAFLLNKTDTGFASSVDVFQVTINKGAENYDIGLWPVANPAISGGLVGSVSAAAIDGRFTTMVTNSLGYDSASNIIVISVTMSDTNTSYFVGLSPVDASILWKTSLSGGFGTEVIDLTRSRITTGISGLVNTTPINAVETRNGALTADSATGLASAVVTSDDVLEQMLLSVTFTTGGSVVAVDGTPDSFSSLALCDVFPTFPPAPTPPGPTTAINLSGPLGGWRGLVGINWRGLALVGDAYSGIVGLSDFSAFTEYGFVQKLVVTSPPIHNDRKRVFLRKFECDIQAATADANTPNPLLNLDWSKDGGETWSPLLVSRSMGKIGEYTRRLRWLNLGESRSWVLRITISDPVRRTIIGCYIDAAPGIG